MGTAVARPDVKRIAANGRVSVGKASAGRLVHVEPTEDGILLRFVRDVPEDVQSQWWLHEPYRSDLKKALEWMATHPAQATDLDELFAKAHHAGKADPAPEKPRSAIKKPAKRARKRPATAR